MKYDKLFLLQSMFPENNTKSKIEQEGKYKKTINWQILRWLRDLFPSLNVYASL